MKQLTKYEVTFYNVNPVTFKRVKCVQIVQAYDVTHAKQIIDRHPSLIKSVKMLNK